MGVDVGANVGVNVDVEVGTGVEVTVEAEEVCKGCVGLQLGVAVVEKGGEEEGELDGVEAELGVGKSVG